jgi:hypothetical protein
LIGVADAPIKTLVVAIVDRIEHLGAETYDHRERPPLAPR